MSLEQRGYVGSVGVIILALGCGRSPARTDYNDLTFWDAIEPGEDCPSGGTKVRTGLDRDNDGKLSKDEVLDTQILCNGQDGAPGSDGTRTLVTTGAEPEGANCENGGMVVRTGTDEDGDAFLDTDEVEATRYVCNGVDQDQWALVESSEEPAGSNCEVGGVAVQSGLDQNQDRVLQAYEVTNVSYACNAPDVVTLVRQDDELPGSNCAHGGLAVHSGLDGDDDEELDTDEITATSFVCHGAPGSNGQNSLLDVEALEPNSDCPRGGILVRSGLDTDGNLVLDEAEVQATRWVCNGGEQAILATSAPFGGVCQRGGVRIQTGHDDDANGVLDEGEVEHTQHVCNAAFTALATGDDYSCALLTDGTARCWGGNGNGRLGDGTSVNRSLPVPVQGLANAVSLVAGRAHTCALLADSAVVCWGSNASGQLGDGTTNDRLTPVAVSGLTDAVALAAGASHTCAVIADGTARCWGSNGNGQLGDTTTNDSPTPVAVSGLAGVASMVAGGNHGCAVLGDGTARCWGTNAMGQLGDGTGVDNAAPVAVTGISGIVSLAASENDSCALLSDGQIYCWGDNSYGQLGDGTPATLRLAPVAVTGLAGAAGIAVGLYHACAVLGDGSAQCWGGNAYGQLGDGTLLGHPTPAAVTGLVGARIIASRLHHTCGLSGDGSAYCWGRNLYGQLGDGTTTDSSTPVHLQP